MGKKSEEEEKIFFFSFFTFFTSFFTFQNSFFDPGFSLSQTLCYRNRFQINVAKADLAETPKLVHLECWDRDALKKDDFMGECWIDGEKFLSSHVGGESIKLEPRNEKNKNEGKGSITCELYHCEPKLSEDFVAALAADTTLGEEDIEKLYDVVLQVTGNRNVITTVDQLQKVLERCDKLDGLVAHLHVSGHSKVHDNLTAAFAQFQTAKKEMCKQLSPVLFPAIDTDGNKSIDVKELVLALHCLSPTADEEAKARFHFKFMDKDKSGTLDKNEIIAMNKFEWKMMRACAEAQFYSMLPTLKQQLGLPSGFSTDSKIKEMIRVIYDDIFENPLLPKQGVELLYKYMDKDNDGTITEEEYVQWRLDADAVQKFQTEIHEVMQQSVVKHFNQEEMMKKLMPKIMSLARRW